MHGWVFHAKQNERDEGDAGDPISLKSIGRRPDRITRIIPCAISDHTRISRIVLLDLEHDLHQVGTDVSDLGKNAAGNSQCRRTQRFANGKAYKAWARVINRNPQQNAEHDQQLNADEHHPNAHPRRERNAVDRIRLAPQAGECCARIREGVHANPKPCHAIAARNSNQAERKNNRQRRRNRPDGGQHSKVKNDDDRDENPEQKQELALGYQVGLTSFINELRDFAHRAVHWQIFQP